MSKRKKIVTLIAYCAFLSCILLGCTNQVNAAGKAPSSFWVEYIDVGQGDSALVQCDGHYLLIDGGPSDASSVVYTVLKNKGITSIDYMIATHPDADHIGGLSGALNYARVKKCYCPVQSHDTKTFSNLEKNLKKQGIFFEIPEFGDEFQLGGAKVTILGPVLACSDTNNQSIVTYITYGQNTFLFAADAELEEEETILRAWKNLDCDVLKVGHHGSDSSTSNAFLKAVKPEYAVISVGKDNSYGHPTERTLKKLQDAGIDLYRTDLQGDIVVSSDGKNLTFSTGKKVSKADLYTGSVQSENAGTVGTKEQNEKAVNPGAYVLNINTKKFHNPSCSSVGDMNPKNRQDVTMSREEVINMGYVPCKRCHP